MADTNKIMHPVTKITLPPTTEFGGTQVRDESTNYTRYEKNLSKIRGVSGSKTVPGAGHSVKTHRG